MNLLILLLCIWILYRFKENMQMSLVIQIIIIILFELYFLAKCDICILGQISFSIYPQ